MNEEVRELLITYGKPHKPVSKDSVRTEKVDQKWIKQMLVLIQQSFKPHSCRSASVSKAKVNSVPTSVILEKGCWKRERESTFKTFYYKDI